MPYCLVEIDTGAPDEVSIEMAIGTQEAAILSGDANGVSINTDWWDSKIAKGDSIIDAYCRKNYAIPFEDPIDPVINHLSCDIAIYEGYQDRQGSAPDWIRRRFEDAMTVLKDIAKGLVPLNVATADAVEGVKPTISFQGTPRLFQRSIWNDGPTE